VSKLAMADALRSWSSPKGVIIEEEFKAHLPAEQNRAVYTLELRHSRPSQSANVFTQLRLLCDIYNSCRFDLVALLHYLKLCAF
jgi:hypothetical protein